MRFAIQEGDDTPNLEDVRAVARFRLEENAIAGEPIARRDIGETSLPKSRERQDDALGTV